MTPSQELGMYVYHLGGAGSKNSSFSSTCLDATHKILNELIWNVEIF